MKKTSVSDEIDFNDVDESVRKVIDTVDIDRVYYLALKYNGATDELKNALLNSFPGLAFNREALEIVFRKVTSKLIDDVRRITTSVLEEFAPRLGIDTSLLQTVNDQIKQYFIDIRGFEFSDSHDCEWVPDLEVKTKTGDTFIITKDGVYSKE